jgi:hypothetical protein
MVTAPAGNSFVARQGSAASANFLADITWR